ncbi:hypothetical protein DL96DRAFT_1706725 [Flagelloscypha sp. PMI_526]|nr:hypothetical protein DL96DRAFT_1706725 [Flagelloscypha sp. PMI_526]
MLQFDAHSPAIYRRSPSNSHQQASSPPPTGTISSFSPSRIFSSISSSIHSQSTDLSNVSPTFSIASPLLSSSSLSTSSLEIIAPTTPSVSYNVHDSAHIQDTRSVWKSFQNSSQDSLLNDRDQRAYHSMEIKEGKKPERLTPPIQTQAEDHLSAACDNTDDEDEWYGLEYTLELSSREDQPADTVIPWSPGEHSRSRESWAALREGLFHPYFEAQDYQEWKNWHRYLDRLDERRRHRKGLAFQHRARDLAWLYAEEFRLRDMIEMQLEAFGTSSRDLSERLVTVMARRPDPFRPPQHHGYSWYLKRSRSVGCLRDLTGTSTGTMIKAE